MNKLAALTLLAVIAATPAMAQQDSTFKQDVKNDAHKVGDSIHRGATTVKRKVAVAQCRDGRYSYTHHHTCSDHGGIKTRLRR